MSHFDTPGLKGVLRTIWNEKNEIFLFCRRDSTYKGSRMRFTVAAPRHRRLAESGVPVTIPEYAAASTVREHPEGWRVEPRACTKHECWKLVLCVVEEQLPKLPWLAAGAAHSLFLGAGNSSLLVCGWDCRLADNLLADRD